MSRSPVSVFDLSPSEKLQLVEDLWDDLAATPEMIPVHDWQKEEVARRKANLQNKPASGLFWEEVSSFPKCWPVFDENIIEEMPPPKRRAQPARREDLCPQTIPLFSFRSQRLGPSPQG